MRKYVEDSRSSTGRGRSWLLYPVWILACGMAFAGLKGTADPALPPGRIAERDAIASAEMELRRHKPLIAYQAVHAAWSSGGESDDGQARWIVLFRDLSARGFRDAVVVEVTGAEGRLIRMRGLPN